VKPRGAFELSNGKNSGENTVRGNCPRQATPILSKNSGENTRAWELPKASNTDPLELPNATLNSAVVVRAVSARCRLERGLSACRDSGGGKNTPNCVFPQALEWVLMDCLAAGTMIFAIPQTRDVRLTAHCACIR
jgi:hypothetical protein